MMTKMLPVVAGCLVMDGLAQLHRELLMESATQPVKPKAIPCASTPYALLIRLRCGAVRQHNTYFGFFLGRSRATPTANAVLK